MFSAPSETEIDGKANNDNWRVGDNWKVALRPKGLQIIVIGLFLGHCANFPDYKLSI